MSSYCHLKWDEITLDLFNRNVASCCQASRSGFKSGIPVSEIFNVPELVADRDAMLNNEKPDSCNYCWNSESSSGVSRRTTTSPITFYKTSTVTFPKTLIVTLQSNLCNLTCVYCSHYYSSTWYKDLQTNGSYSYNSDLYSLSNKDKIKYKVSLIDYAQSQLGNVLTDIINDPNFYQLEQISIGGGEPLLAPSLIPTIKTLTSKNPHLKILISTGLGVSDTQFENFVKETKDQPLILSVSNETVGKLSEFVRYGITWDKWVERLNILKTCSNYTLKTTCVASIVTIHGLDEFLTFYKLQGFTKEQVEFNFLETPAFMDLKNFDPSITADAIYALINNPLLQDCYKKTLLGIQSVQSHNAQTLKDLSVFLTEYATRRNLDLAVLSDKLTNSLDL